jgi:hypothetical protein
MTASRSTGNPHSLAPTARLVEVQGLGAASLRWLTDQGWIDVSSNSWLSLIAPEVGQTLGVDDTPDAFYHAANRLMVLAASGNGTAYSQGAAPTPTYLLSTAAPGVVLVGGHDNGRLTLWSGAPPQVVADAYGGYAAMRTSTTEIKPDPISCCTSAAAPYAAGGAAAIILKARQILGDHSTGYSGPAGDPAQRIVARGAAGQVPSGPLADGDLTLQEVRDILEKTAQARPVEGRDDGLLNPVASGNVSDALPYGPGANPFCQGCVTVPLQWSQVPDGPAYPQLGYGAVNEFSTALAMKVLSGEAPLPARAGEDAFMAQDASLRRTLFTNNDDARVTPWAAPPAALGCTDAATATQRPAQLANTGRPMLALGLLAAAPVMLLLAAVIGRRRRTS